MDIMHVAVFTYTTSKMNILSKSTIKVVKVTYSNLSEIIRYILVARFVNINGILVTRHIITYGI